MGANRILDFDSAWFTGMNSAQDPGTLPPGYYWNSMNTINTGGVISCRPGYRCIVKFPKGNLQGAAIFRPQVGLEQLLVVIDGIVYVAPYPFIEFRQLPNVLMLPWAKQVYFKQAVQSARRLDNTMTSPIEVINPRNVIFIQDGGNTAPAWYDGSDSGHVRDNQFETPVGSSMEWVGDRLWVAQGNRVFASDISNPFSFREQIYLGSVAGFEFTGDVTALAKTPSLESPQLAVFTEQNASVLQANVRDRSKWPTIDGFQIEMLQTGCPGQRAIINHSGLLLWFSSGGLVAFDFATAGKIATRLPIRDTEMSFSKTLVSDNRDLIACSQFGQYFLCSVPSGDYYNKDTWCLNDVSKESLTASNAPSWCSVWRGTRPVQWVQGVIAGVERAYHVSFDEDGENRLWETFIPDRLDNGCPITWYVETRGYFGPSSGVQKIAGQLCRMQWAEIALSGIQEDLNLGVFFAGSLRGGYKNILAKKISVEKGSLDYRLPITATTKLFAYKPQERVERTQDANQQSTTLNTGTCGVESLDLEGIDDSFQLLVIGQGPATIRWIRAWGLVVSETLKGDPDACIDETPFNAVRFDGPGAHSDNLAVTSAELAARDFQHFTSVQTRTVTQDNFQAVGVGTAESVISQSAADRVAGIIAVKQAEAELRFLVPPVLSVGNAQ